jgi:hypothetical protein
MTGLTELTSKGTLLLFSRAACRWWRKRPIRCSVCTSPVEAQRTSVAKTGDEYAGPSSALAHFTAPVSTSNAVNARLYRVRQHGRCTGHLRRLATWQFHKEATCWGIAWKSLSAIVILRSWRQNRKAPVMPNVNSFPPLTAGVDFGPLPWPTARDSWCKQQDNSPAKAAYLWMPQAEHHLVLILAREQIDSSFARHGRRMTFTHCHLPRFLECRGPGCRCCEITRYTIPVAPRHCGQSAASGTARMRAARGISPLVLAIMIPPNLDFERH